MNKQKQVLILYSDADEAATSIRGLQELSGHLVRLGALVTVRELNDNYGEILDSIAVTDTIVFWR